MLTPPIGGGGIVGVNAGAHAPIEDEYTFIKDIKKIGGHGGMLLLIERASFFGNWLAGLLFTIAIAERGFQISDARMR